MTIENCSLKIKEKAQSRGVGVTLGKIVDVRSEPLSGTTDAPAVAVVVAAAVAADRRAKPAAEAAEAVASSPSGRDDDDDGARRKPFP